MDKSKKEKISKTHLKNISGRAIFKMGFASALAGLLFFAAAAFAEAASLRFVPQTGTFYKDENFTVNVTVDADVPINAAQGLVTFPTEYLEVISVQRNNINSIIDLWVQKPSFSNAGEVGNVSFEGVALNPGFIGEAGVVTQITFQVKKAGTADLYFAEFSILANDGVGTNVATANGSARFTLSPARPLPKPKSAEQGSLDLIAEKIGSFENALENLRPAKTGGNGASAFWDVLPGFLKIGILILVGVATLLLIFIIISLGVITLIWIWSRAWHRKADFSRWVRSAGQGTLNFGKKTLVFMKLAEKEVAGDLKYAAKELNRDVRVAKEDPSFAVILKNYWASIWKVIKRFLTYNNRAGKGD